MPNEINEWDIWMRLMNEKFLELIKDTNPNIQAEQM